MEDSIENLPQFNSLMSKLNERLTETGLSKVIMKKHYHLKYHLDNLHYTKSILLLNTVLVMDQTSVEKKVDVNSTFIENIFRSGLTLVSS